MQYRGHNQRWFTKEVVESVPPNQIGVYFLLRQDEIIYVGKGDIRQRLLDHLNGDNPCILSEKPTHWVGQIIKDIDEREKQLILQSNPICNKKIG